MARKPIVGFEDIDQSASTTKTVEVTDTELLPSRLGKPRRSACMVTNVSPTTIYVSLGDSPATANAGIVLQQNQTATIADDAGFDCYQGAIRAIGSAQSTVAVIEVVPFP